MDGYAIRAADVAGATEDAPVRLDGGRRGARRGGAGRPGPGRDGDPDRDRGADAAGRRRRGPGRATRRRSTSTGGAGSARPRGRRARCRPRASSTPRVKPGNAIRTPAPTSVAATSSPGPATPVTPRRRRARVAGAGVGTVAVRRRADRRGARDGRRGARPGHGPRTGRDPRRERPRAPRRSSARPAASPLDLGIAVDRSRTSRRGSGAASPRRTSSSCRGGVSVGPYDVVRLAFDNVGHIEPVAGRGPAGQAVRVRAGGRRRPRRRRSLLFGLPGNPVSSFVTFELFVRPVLRRLAGHARLHRPVDRAVLEEPVTKSLGRRGVPAGDRPCGTRTGSPVRDGRAGSACASRAGRGVTCSRRSPPRTRWRSSRSRSRRRRPAARSRSAGSTAADRTRLTPDAARPRPGSDRTLQEGPWIAATPRARNAAASPTSIVAAGRAWSTSAPSPRPPAAPSPRPRSPCRAETMSLVIDGGGSKGDVLTVAELAGVMGGKRTSELIPLCHPIAADRPRRDDHARPGRRRAPDPRRGRDDRPDGRRDGGDDRRVGRRPDGLRHGQGRRARRGDPRRPAASRRPAARAASGTGPRRARAAGAPRSGGERMAGRVGKKKPG